MLKAALVKTHSVQTLGGLHSLDRFYSQNIKPLSHDSSNCFTQQHTPHVHLQDFSTLPIFLHTIAAIIEFWESIGGNLLPEKVLSVAYFSICLSFLYFPHHLHDHLGDQNCFICILIRLIASRRPLGEAQMVGVAIILKVIKYHTTEEV